MIKTTLCYVYRGSQVLMVYRNKKENDFHLGKWNGLGGKIEPGETPEQGVIREVYEESGIIIESPTLVGECLFPNFEGHGEDEYVYIYVATTDVMTVSDCLEGDLYWVEEKEILSLNLWESDQVFLPYVFRRIPFFGTFNFKGKKLINYQVEEKITY
ncbi:MAG TPA: 8-oxo-dGTP diphosphatase [Firmicutes bacterium]|nr:8-oxo-dGTP diphosphatase [Bacillota bacterium]